MQRWVGLLAVIALGAQPAGFRVATEASRQTTWMRWAWGTVGALQPPANRALAEFDSPDDVLFRVRVTSPGTPEEPHGLLLAESDRVRLRSPEELNDPRTPLLPVVPSHDLGELVEQLASRQKLVTICAFLAAATTLYVDPQTKLPKRGGGGKSRGTARRLADVCNQFDVTWDLYAMEADELLTRLPKEFERFRPVG